ncbi:MAG TPA: hypothetical protein VFK54_06300 [Candidatus Limnocylindrales bacterium]|nr:hypothetical protein [Candidatus Limnocylindrales bacterium]
MNATTPPSWRRRLAGTALLVSAPLGAVSVVALVGMFAGFAVGARATALTLGRINDTLAIPTVLLIAPTVVELFVLTGPERRPLRVAVAAIGLGGIAWIAWLQWLLVTERVTFEEQVGSVMVGFAGLATWFIVTGRQASRAGLMPGGTRLGVLAALNVGQPWWALQWGRLLRRQGSGDARATQRVPGEATFADRYPAAAGDGPAR